tara:strand:+ start:1684 stop:2046 length:363 start_codon:yes stop_codon:yes gene_type:complete
MKINKRHDELSQKIFKMGNALVNEGTKKKDYIITNIGNFMVLVSGLMYEENDIHLFGELCAMFSAKKVLDSQNEDLMDKFENMTEGEIINMYEKIRSDINNLGIDDIDNEDFDEDFNEDD